MTITLPALARYRSSGSIRLFPTCANYGDAFYLVGSNYIWPQKMNEAIRRAADKAGGHVVGEEYVPFGTKDLASILRKISLRVLMYW